MWTLVYIMIVSSTKTIYDPVSIHPTLKECKHALHDIQSTEKFDKYFSLKCVKKND